MSKQFWGVIAVIVVIFVGIFALGGNGKKSGGDSGTPTNHIEGQGSTGVTLVEYGDYECPYCGEYFPTLQQVYNEYSGKVYFQFRNFPLVNVHQNAFAAARAAEAAGLQGKFWEMHDLLYEQNDQFYNSGQTTASWINASDPTTYFVQDAAQLGLNVTKFKSDYQSSKVNDLINADMSVGTKLNITGTPTFYLDGKMVQVGNSVSAFEKILNNEIAKKTGHSPSQTATTGASPAPTATTEQTKE